MINVRIAYLNKQSPRLDCYSKNQLPLYKSINIKHYTL